MDSLSDTSWIPADIEAMIRAAEERQAMPWYAAECACDLAGDLLRVVQIDDAFGEMADLYYATLRNAIHRVVLDHPDSEGRWLALDAVLAHSLSEPNSAASLRIARNRLVGWRLEAGQGVDAAAWRIDRECHEEQSALLAAEAEVNHEQAHRAREAYRRALDRRHWLGELGLRASDVVIGISTLQATARQAVEVGKRRSKLLPEYNDMLSAYERLGPSGKVTQSMVAADLGIDERTLRHRLRRYRAVGLTTPWD